MNRKEFITGHKGLFRDTPADGVSESLIVERGVQYGTLLERKQIVELLGYQKTKDIFTQLVQHPKQQFTPEYIWLFSHFFKIHEQIAYEDIITRAKSDPFLYR